MELVTSHNSRLISTPYILCKFFHFKIRKKIVSAPRVVDQMIIVKSNQAIVKKQYAFSVDSEDAFFFLSLF